MGTVPKSMKISLVTCVITITTMSWGKHFMIKTLDTANNNLMKFSMDDATNREPIEMYGNSDYRLVPGHHALCSGKKDGTNCSRGCRALFCAYMKCKKGRCETEEYVKK